MEEDEMLRVLLALILLGALVQQALADCEYQGKRYPTGTKIGDKTCMKDGSWR
jgi:hypothetical protein